MRFWHFSFGMGCICSGRGCLWGLASGRFLPSIELVEYRGREVWSRDTGSSPLIFVI